MIGIVTGPWVTGGFVGAGGATGRVVVVGGRVVGAAVFVRVVVAAPGQTYRVVVVKAVVRTVVGDDGIIGRAAVGAVAAELATAGGFVTPTPLGIATVAAG